MKNNTPIRKLIIKMGRKTQVRIAGSSCSSGSDIIDLENRGGGTLGRGEET
jgi:hypothetical protein